MCFIGFVLKFVDDDKICVYGWVVMDVFLDLIEFGWIVVIVVCVGVKFIFDILRMFEFLVFFINFLLYNCIFKFCI